VKLEEVSGVCGVVSVEPSKLCEVISNDPEIEDSKEVKISNEELIGGE
jgi:hypothetical protein